MRLEHLTPAHVLPLAGLLAVPLLAAVPAAATDQRPAATVVLSWDFDGDGVLDLAGGQPGHEEGGPGRVLVRRGTGDGYADPTVLVHPVPTEGNDAFGAALASADLDHDGYADLVVGAPSAYGTPGTHGSVTVFRGSAAGLSQDAQTTVAWPSRPDGDQVSFGRSLVIADLRGDGWPDIAVGAPDDDGDRGTDRSRLYVLRGEPAGFSPTRSYAVVPPSGSRWFGETLAVGDVEHDGHLDLVESAGYPGKEHVTYLRGTDTGPHRARVLSTGWAQSLAVGDVTGDGLDDIVATRPYAHYDNTVRRPYVGAGRVTLFGGSPTGPRAGVSVTQGSAGVPTSARYGDLFGSSAALVDVNGNGRREVVVGMPGREVGDVKDAGAVVVLRVGATGFRRHGNRLLTQATSGVPGDPRRGGRFGDEVAAQDRTRDGLPDLLVRSRGRYDQPRLLTQLRVLDAPLLSGGGTAEDVLDGTLRALPRDGSSG
jgi:hypothetical protein